MSANIRSFSLKSTRLFLNEYGYSSPDSELWGKLKTDPLFPSVRSLDFHFGFPYSNGVAVACGISELAAYDKPFIAELKSSQLTLVTKIDGSKLSLIDAKFKPREVTVETFETIWSGKAFILEHYKENRDNFFHLPSNLTRGKISTLEKIGQYEYDSILILALSLIGYLCFLGREGLYLSAFSSFVATVLLFDSSTLLNKGQLFVNSICGQGGDHSCNKAFDYKISLPFTNRGLKISTLGLFYYLWMGTFMFGAFLQFDKLNDLVAIVLLLPLGVIPVTIYLQGFVIKKWCKVCLVVTLLIVLSAVDLLNYYDYGALFVNNPIKDIDLGLLGLALFSVLIVLLFVQKVELKGGLNFWKGYNNFLWSFPGVSKEINNAFCAPGELPEMYIVASDKKQGSIGVLNVLLKPGCKHCSTILEYFKNKSDSYLRLMNINFIVSGSEMDRTRANGFVNDFNGLDSLRSKFNFLQLRLNEKPSSHKKEEGRILKRTGYPSVEINGVIVPPFLVGQDAMLDFILRVEYEAK